MRQGLIKRTCMLGIIAAAFFIFVLGIMQWAGGNTEDDTLRDMEASIRKQKSGDFSDKATVIMPTYKRTHLLQETLEHYCTMETIIDRIIIVWNNVGETVPKYLQELKCPIPIVFKEQKVNSLHNRFIKYPDIQTNCEYNGSQCCLICVSYYRCAFFG